LHNTFITLHPFAGKRFMYRKIFFDVTAGFDAGFCLRTKESGTAQYTVNNNEHTLAFSNQLAKPWVDIRPTMSIRTGFKKWSCIAGYSLGLTNFKIGTRGKAFSDFLRLGLSYQIK